MNGEKFHFSAVLSVIHNQNGRYPKNDTPFLKSFDNTRVAAWRQTAGVTT